MYNIQEIEIAVSQLPPEELNRFREWFEEFENEIWDRQFESDVKSGKLDRLTPLSFLDTALCLELDGPPDWSANLEEYLYRVMRDAKK